MLGWDVGTFEFTSDRITASGYGHHAALKLRTGGSVAKISRTQAKSVEGGQGYYWDLVKSGNKNNIKLPVKFRYRSPVVFELHRSGSRSADGYAMIWLQHLIDNEDTPFDVPIWKTKMPARLTQNYVTEENLRAKQSPGLEDIEEIGRLQFRGHFKAGMDESHRDFIADNDSRETYESWEACLSEGVRQRWVEKEVPEKLQRLHEESLLEGRDVLKAADDSEKNKWLGRDGANWSGAFGHDPKAYMQNGKKAREPGAEPPLHDPYNPSSDDDDDDDNDSASELGVEDAASTRSATGQSRDQPRGSFATGRDSAANDSMMSELPEDEEQKQVKRTMARKHRGLMQWKPARNAKFAADEGRLGLRKLKQKITGGLEGRQPDVDTEV